MNERERMTYKPQADQRTTGPTLETYVETRFNLLVDFINEKFSAQDVAMRASVDALQAVQSAATAAAAASQSATDLRYQQRFEAQSDALDAAFLSQQTAMTTAFVVAEKAVQAALAAADRAVSKAELAADKRFESVNEFRQTLDDQQRTLMPRQEADVIFRGLAEKVGALERRITQRDAESSGTKGGWVLAIGAIGFVVMMLSALVAIAFRFL